MSSVAESVPPRTARARVLIVDPERSSLRGLAAWLSYKYDVVTALDGIEGLERALESTPDAIVSEVSMPRLDGPAMVRTMRQVEALRRVPVVFLATKTSPRTVVAAITAGARAYMQKPVDLDVLDRKLDSAARFVR